MRFGLLGQSSAQREMPPDYAVDVCSTAIDHDVVRVRSRSVYVHGTATIAVSS